MPASRPVRKTTSRAAPLRWVTAADSAIHGRGVYARELIPDGTHVIEYTGERITKAESKRRELQRLERQRAGGDDSVYIFTLNARHDLDGRTHKNIARLINHSCAPNCRAEIIRGRIWLIARREIPAGAELTFDYGFPFPEWRLHPCRCGAPRCAGFIVGAGQRWRLRKIPRAERALYRAR
ncbi:MAG: SET domain-containing protein-lysine N-methyltransferase [Verrucomicrobiota bacterium]